MIVQYPHILTGTITANAIFDAVNGNWIEGTPTNFSQRCRAEEKAGGYIPGKDGVNIDYSWTIYMPKDAPQMQVGTKVTVSNNGSVFLNDVIKGFFRHQFNAEVWL